MSIYKAMTNGYCSGVIELPSCRWVVEPEFTWRQAESMAKALNENPDIPVDELYRLAEAE